MINLNKSYVAELGFQLVTPGSAVCHASSSFIEPSYVEINHEKILLSFSPSLLIQEGQMSVTGKSLCTAL